MSEKRRTGDDANPPDVASLFVPRSLNPPRSPNTPNAPSPPSHPVCKPSSIFIQAKELCEAGIDIEKAINYLESRFLPTGYDKEKLRYEVNRSYGKNAEMFGMKRGEYKPYSEYKKSKSKSN